MALRLAAEWDETLCHAQEAGLYLVEVQPGAEPPVCCLMDYGRRSH